MLRLVSNSSEFEIKLDFKGLCYIYLSTWPYIFAEIKHFAALSDDLVLDWVRHSSSISLVSTYFGIPLAAVKS